MDSVAKAGLLAGHPTNFATNTMVIVAAAGNQKDPIFADLTRPGGSNVVVCRQIEVPCGSATRHRRCNRDSSQPGQ